MAVLDVIPRSKCDERGIPLDWERCRWCGGGGMVTTDKPGKTSPYPCRRCGGHGSLKAAALDFLSNVSARGADDHDEHRCEDCNHPMSEGTWEDRGSLTVERAMEYVVLALREGHPNPTAAGIHYSRCDEDCDHGGAGRVLDDGEWFPYRDLRAIGKLPENDVREASWREVEVRFKNGWPNDLRPENLLLLCTRCEAARLPA